MTRIDFYSNADSRLHAACRIVAKAHQRRTRVLVYTPDETVARGFDTLLWTHQALGFTPHCMAGHPLAAETPVLIATAIDAPPHDELLLNLGAECPPAFSRFQRLIEVIGREDGEREDGRARWRYYKDRGYTIEHHDLAARTAG